jgi:hypothetical protein
MIAGDHLNVNPGAATPPHGLNRLGPRRIDHSLQPEKRQTAGHVIVLEVRVLGMRFPAGERQDTQALRSHFLHRHGV